MNFRTSVLVFAIFASLPGHAGKILDRIVATVNGRIVLYSDWEDAVRYEAFVEKRPLRAVSAVDRKAALDHLIDQELLREQMRASDSVEPTEPEIARQIDQVRQEYAAETTGTEWKDLLASHGLTGEELRRRIALQLKLTRLVDTHLRPAANITSKNIESYYQQELLPQLHQAGAKDVPLIEVTPTIKELLTQQKITELLVAWLHDLHAGSQIHTELYSPGGENVRQ